MQLKDIIVMARRSIKANKLRARITIAIIAIGITALVGIITAIQGIEDTISSSFSRMGSNTINITQTNFFGNTKKTNTGKRRVQSTNDAKKIKLQQAVDFKSRFTFPCTISINSLLSQQALVKTDKTKSNPNIWIMAADENYLKVADIDIAFGRNLSVQEANNGRDLCVIGNLLAENLFGKKVQRAIGQTINVENKKFVVVGVLKTKGVSMIDKTDNMVLISIENARRQFDINSKSFVVSIRVDQIQQMEYASSEAEGLMRSVRKLPLNISSDFELSKNDAIAEKLKDNLKYVRLMAVIIGLITLLGAAIGLMNIMLVAVVERTKEIGLSIAMGATSKIIRTQFLCESIIISIIGGIWGIGIGILLGNLVALGVGATFRIPWNWIGIAVAVCAIVGVLSGIYPAIKASKLNPNDALRYE
jgi:putative ABC transport system permease protein